MTNAKHIAEDDLVVVATQGAIVPAGEEPEPEGQGIEVKKAVVGGHASEGMLCDGIMLGWPAGAAGVLVKLNDVEGCELGGVPPLSKPRKN